MNTKDFTKLYEESEKELQTLKNNKAILQNKIKESAEKLGVKPEKDVIERLIKETSTKKEGLEAKLQDLVDKLDKITTPEEVTPTSTVAPISNEEASITEEFEE